VWPSIILVFHIPHFKSRIHFPLLRSFQKIFTSLLNISEHGTFYGELFLCLRPTRKLDDLPLSAVRRVLFHTSQLLWSLEVVSSIRSLRTCRAVVTGSLLTCAVSVFRGLVGYEAWKCLKVHRTIRKRNTPNILYVDPKRINFLRSHTLIKLVRHKASVVKFHLKGSRPFKKKRIGCSETTSYHPTPRNIPAE
jgi:hypothetical protein